MYGLALLGPGLIDLDALSDLDTTVLGLGQPSAAEEGPHLAARAMPSAGRMRCTRATSWHSRSATRSRQLLRRGITTALPIASLFYREWGETAEEFAAAADTAAALGLRVYLGPAYRSGGLLVEEDGRIVPQFDEARGLAGLEDAIRFCRDWDGAHGGLVPHHAGTGPDRDLYAARREAARDLAVPVRLHCCQSRLEYELVLRLHGMSPPSGCRVWASSRRAPCCRTPPGSAAHAASTGPVGIWRSCGMRAPPSCTARSSRPVADGRWKASHAAARWGCAWDWVRIPGRRTWWPTCRPGSCCAGWRRATRPPYAPRTSMMRRRWPGRTRWAGRTSAA